jgi:hypothetical protein
MRQAIVALAVFLTFILAACGADPTPFPVDLPPTPTATPDAAALLPLKYAFLPNTAGVIPDLALIQGSGGNSGIEVTQLTDPAADLTTYDIVVGYGDQQGWTRSELTPHITMILNPAVAPLNRPELLAVVRRSINPADTVTALNLPGALAETVDHTPPTALRTELANLGLPDGIALAMAVTYVPGAEQIAAQMRAANIEIQPLLMTVNEARIKPGLSLSFTPGGFPLVTR